MTLTCYSEYNPDRNGATRCARGSCSSLDLATRRNRCGLCLFLRMILVMNVSAQVSGICPNPSPALQKSQYLDLPTICVAKRLKIARSTKYRLDTCTCHAFRPHYHGRHYACGPKILVELAHIRIDAINITSIASWTRIKIGKTSFTHGRLLLQPSRTTYSSASTGVYVLDTVIWRSGFYCTRECMITV